MHSLRLFTLSLGLTYCIAGQIPEPTSPTISDIYPTTAEAASSFQITVSGSGFSTLSRVRWNGSALTTTCLSTTQLTAVVNLVLAPGDYVVDVINSPSEISNSKIVNVTSPVPAVTGTEPSVIPVKTYGFDLLVNGSKFVVGAKVFWNGVAVNTIFQSTTALKAAVSGDLSGSPGLVGISVLNPGNSTPSNQVELRVYMPSTISALDPSSVAMNGPGFTLSITGANFVADSVALWNGTALGTTVVSPTQLTAIVPAALLTTAGSKIISIAGSSPSSNIIELIVAGLTPQITSYSPMELPAGYPYPEPITFHGTGFASGARVYWDQTSLDTYRLSQDGEIFLKAYVSGEQREFSGVYRLTAVNPGGAASNAVPVMVKHSLAASVPGILAAGAPDTVISITGAGFTPAAVVELVASGTSWPLVTTYASSRQLTAVLPSVRLTTASAASLQVRDLAGASNSIMFTIRPAPVITGIDPSTIRAGNPQMSMRITGSDFFNGCTARWNGSVLSTFLMGADALQSSVPEILVAKAGSAAVDVDCFGSISNSLTVTILEPMPQISSVEPSQAPAGSAGITLKLLGRGFSAGSVVNWSGTPLATSFVSSTKLAAELPSSLLALGGQYRVEVVNPDGATSTARFDVEPLLAGISPPSATSNDVDIQLTLTGVGFSTTSVVYISGSPSIPLQTVYVSSTSLKAVLPARTGTQGYAGIPLFVYVDGARSNIIGLPVGAPCLKSIFPTSATAGAPTFDLQVYGIGFTAGSIVEWNGEALVTTYIDAGTLKAVVPATHIASAGSASIQVSNPNGSLPGTATFTIAGPFITNLTPGAAHPGDADLEVSITGGGLASGAVALWNETPLSTTFFSSDFIRAVIPSRNFGSVGSASLRVRNPNGVTTNSLAFQVYPPRVSYTTPSYAPAGGPDLTLRVNGLGFVAGAVVQWNGQVLETNLIDNRTLTVLVPAALMARPGFAALRVISAGGASDELTFQIERPLPVLAAMAPGEVEAGGPEFTLVALGQDFRDGIKVYWDSVPLATVFESFTRVRATVPTDLLRIAGSHAISAGYEERQGFALKFWVQPVLHSVSPASVPAGSSNTTVVVKGVGFPPNGMVTFLGATVVYTYVDSTTLNVVLPASSLTIAREGQILVRPQGGAGRALPFSVTGGFVVGSISPNSVLVGSDDFILTVKGSGFVSTDRIRWNAAPLVTTFVSSGELRALVPSSSIAMPGQASVEVASISEVLTNSVKLTITTPGPVLSALSPNSAMAGSESAVLSISGSGFVEGAFVSWGDTPLSTTFVSATQLTAVAPALLLGNAGPAQITAVNPGSALSNSLTFTVSPRVKLYSLHPDRVLAGETGFTLTIWGSDFVSGAVVRWNSTRLSTTLVNSGQLTASVPQELIAGPTPVAITVMTPDGITSANSLPVNVLPRPSVTAISPTSAFAGSAGFILTIYGTSFTRDTKVNWNKRVLTTTFVSPAELKALVPSFELSKLGIVNISVGLLNGSWSNSLPFTVAAGASILTASPNQIDAGSPALPLTILGSNFSHDSKIVWSDRELATTYLNETQLQAAVPQALMAISGTYHVSVAGAAGERSNSFPIYIQPVFTGMEPQSVPEGAPPTTLTLKGIGFAPNTALVFIRFYGISQLPTSYVDPTTLTVVVPANLLDKATQVNTYLQHVDGAFSRVQVLSIGDAPRISSLSPASVTYGAPGFTLTVNGSRFEPGAVVRWNDLINLATTYVSANQLTAYVPADLIGPGAFAGEAPLNVINPDGKTSGPFTLSITPTLQSLNPSSAAAGGSSFTLTVTGDGFNPNAVVQWNDVPLLTSFTSPTCLEADVPAALIAGAQTVAITVSGEGAQSGRLPLTVLGGSGPGTAPRAVNSASLEDTIAPGSLFLLTGSNLAPGEATASVAPLPTELNGVTVTINGIAAPLFYVGPAQITAQVPLETPAGAASIRAQWNGQTTASLEGKIVAAGPGVFVTQPGAHAVAQNFPDWTLNTAGNPAGPGQYVIIYVTGLGPLDRTVETGKPAPLEPLAKAISDVRAAVGGKPAEVSYAGLTPGAVGLGQVNIRIPDVPSGEQPLEITVGGVKSNTATISVRGN